MMMSYDVMICVRAGHHSSWHRREDLHAIPNVRYDVRWRSFLTYTYPFFPLLFISSIDIFTLTIIFTLRRLCTIWNTNCESYTQKTQFHIFYLYNIQLLKLTTVCSCPFDTAIPVTYSCMYSTQTLFGNRWNQQHILYIYIFCPIITSHHLVSSRSLAFFFQTRLCSLPLFGRYCEYITM